MRRKVISMALLVTIMSMFSGCAKDADVKTTETSGNPAAISTEVVTDETATDSEAAIVEDATSSETDTATEADAIPDNIPVAEDASVLGQDKSFSYDGESYNLPFDLQAFLAKTGYVINAESEGYALDDIAEFGHASVLIDTVDGNFTGIVFDLQNIHGTEVSDVKNLQVTDFDIDSTCLKNDDEESKAYRDAHPVTIPGGATWNTEYFDLLGIYGKPTTTEYIGDEAVYYEFEFTEELSGTVYEVKAFFENGAKTPYRYMYDVIEN